MSINSQNDIDLISTLSNRRKLKAFLRVLPVNTVLEMQYNFSTVTDELKQEHEKQQTAERQRQEKIEEYRALLKAEGFDLNELVGSITESASKPVRATRPAKYEFMDNGYRKTWTGQGRMPLPLKVAIEQGKTLNDFLIK